MTTPLRVALLTIVALIALSFVPRLHSDPEDYPFFADDAAHPLRNVVSNAGLLAVGSAGVTWAARNRRRLADDFAAAMTLFAGVIATAFGSAYFHSFPLEHGALNRFTLLWDRLPMSVAFAGTLALVLRDRVFRAPRRLALPLLVGTGVATVLYWYLTPSHDLYPYAFFQLYTAAGTLLMVLFLRPSYTEGRFVVAAVLLFGMAKVVEERDDALYARFGFGGHPLKHVAAAVAALMILAWLMKRRARA